MSRARAAVRRMLGPLVGDRVAELELSTRHIVGNLQITGSSCWSWYQLSAQPWAYTAMDQRVQVWDQVRARLSGLAGHAIKLRISSRPFPAYQFARDLDESTKHPLPDVEGAPSWDDYLEGQQHRLRTRLLDDKVVVLGIRVGSAPSRATVSALKNAAERPVSGSEAGKLIDQLRALDALVGGSGLGARPLTASQMAWLVHRSVAMGMPVPLHTGAAGGVWEHDDLFAFTDPVNWIFQPLAPTVRIEATVSGNSIVRHVAVLSVGRMPEMNFPEDGRTPWMLATDRLDFPVEWSTSGLIVAPRDLHKAVEFEKARALGIEAHYDEHGEHPPPAVERAIEHATQVYDEVTEGDPRVAVRFSGPVRLAVHAPTREECLSRVRQVVDLYSDQLRIEIAHPQPQHELLREFIPGEPWSMTGYQRRMSVGYVAAAMPHVSSAVGTPSGPYLGYTIGSARRAVRHDGHFPMEILNAPGLVPVTAEPGGGKSYLLGVLAYHAVKRGEPTCILDPSGPLAKLCDMPELAPHSRRLDLTEADPGTLAPWQLIPEPKPHEFESDREYHRAVRRAHSERQQLGFDVMRMMLPSSLLINHQSDAALHDAIRALGGDATVNPSNVIRILEHQGSEISREIATHLRDASEFPLGELVFPDHLEPIPLAISDDKTLAVITMPGLQVPDADMPRERWSVEELYSTPLLHLAAFYTSKFIYSRSRDIRKNLMLDENEIMGRWGSGRALFVRLGRDTRKHDAAVYASSQHPDDHLEIGKIDALIGGAFVGRLEDAQAARSAMRLLRAPDEFADTIMRLSPKPPPGQPAAQSGQFLYRDAFGRIERVQVDAQWHPDLHETLVSTPGARPRAAAHLSSIDHRTPPTRFLDSGMLDATPAA